MSKCDRTTCSNWADEVVRFRAAGTTRTYCNDCLDELETQPGLEWETVRRL